MNIKCLIVSTALLAGVTTAAFSQTRVSSEILAQRLAEIDSQIADLTRQREQAETEWTAVQDRLKQQRQQLAGQVLETAFEKQQLTRRRDRAMRRLEQHQHLTGQRLSAAEKLAERLVTLAEGIDLHLAESPDAVVLAETESAMPGKPGPHMDWQAWSEAAVRQLALFDRLHARAVTIQIDRTTLYTADGTFEPVDLLSAGRIGFAYRTISDGRLGIAVAGSADAVGFRWVESLDRVSRRQLEQLFDGTLSGDSIYRIPIDVTGRISAESVRSAGGWVTTLRQGGLVMIPLLGVALAALVLMVERFWFLACAGRGGQAMAESVLSACRQKEFALAEKHAQKAGGVVSRVLLACLQRRRQGLHAMEDSIQEQLLFETPQLERFLTGMAVLGAVAPLLGLLGTVTGIIQTFAVITAFGNAQPGAMAGGISEALVTTAAGLTIAIPILLMHSVLSAKADRIVSDAEKHAAALLNVLGEDA